MQKRGMPYKRVDCILEAPAVLAVIGFSAADPIDGMPSPRSMSDAVSKLSAFSELNSSQLDCKRVLGSHHHCCGQKSTCKVESLALSHGW